MRFFFILMFVAGVMFGVRVLFFGAEKRTKRSEHFDRARISELAAILGAISLGTTGYVLTTLVAIRPARVLLWSFGVAIVTVIFGSLVSHFFIRLKSTNLDDLDALQGMIALVIQPIGIETEGQIRVEHSGAVLTLMARDLTGASVGVGREVCIGHIDAGVAYVEDWSLVEQRI